MRLALYFRQSKEKKIGIFPLDIDITFIQEPILQNSDIREFALILGRSILILF